MRAVPSLNYFVWIRSVFTMAMTRKSSKSRMGKGKGKLLYYMGVLHSGCFFTEALCSQFVQLRLFLKQLRCKLPVSAQVVFSDKNFSITSGQGATRYVPEFDSNDDRLIYRLRPQSSLFGVHRCQHSYINQTARAPLSLNVSPFGSNLCIFGFGRSVTLQQTYAASRQFQHAYLNTLYPYWCSLYYRTRAARFYWWLASPRILSDFYIDELYSTILYSDCGVSETQIARCLGSVRSFFFFKQQLSGDTLLNTSTATSGCLYLI